MPTSTTFADRIARIEARAAEGLNTGFVTPGVADDTACAPKTPRKTRDRGSALGAVMGGLFATLSIIAVGVAFVLSDIKEGNLDQIASILLTGSD